MAHVVGVTSYLGLYNLLDFSAGTLPVSSVTVADVAAMEAYPTRCAVNANYRRVKKVCFSELGNLS